MTQGTIREKEVDRAGAGELHDLDGLGKDMESSGQEIKTIRFFVIAVYQIVYVVRRARNAKRGKSEAANERVRNAFALQQTVA